MYLDGSIMTFPSSYLSNMHLMKAHRSRSCIDVDQGRYERMFTQLHSYRHIRLISPDNMYLDGSIMTFPSSYLSNMRLMKAYRSRSSIDVDHGQYERMFTAIALISPYSTHISRQHVSRRLNHDITFIMHFEHASDESAPV